MPHRWLAVFFGAVGAATIAATGAALLLSRGGSPALVSIAILCGLAELLTGYGLWQRSKLGPRAFLSWCLTIALFMAAFLFEEPSAGDPLLLVPAIGLVAVLYFGWRYIARVCARAA